MGKAAIRAFGAIILSGELMSFTSNPIKSVAKCPSSMDDQSELSSPHLAQKFDTL